jgi:hypothetical protein
MPGKHRGPPPDPRPDWRWRTIAALAGLGILAPPVSLAAAAVAPDATDAGVHGATVAPTARATPTVLTAGPLAIPEIGASGAWEPPSTTTAQSPATVTKAPVRTQRPARTVQARTRTLVTQEALPEQTVTLAPQPVTTEQAQPTPTEAPSPDPVTAAQESATPTPEEPAVTPEPTVEPAPVTVDVPIPDDPTPTP